VNTFARERTFKTFIDLPIVIELLGVAKLYYSCDGLMVVCGLGLKEIRKKNEENYFLSKFCAYKFKCKVVNKSEFQLFRSEMLTRKARKLAAISLDSDKNNEKEDQVSRSPKKSRKNEILEDLELLGGTIFSSPSEDLRPMLQRALTNCFIDDEQWLSASVMNFMLSKIALQFRSTVYFSEQFSIIHITPNDYETIEDILTRPVKHLKPITSIVWLVNNRNIHWTLIRANIQNPNHSTESSSTSSSTSTPSTTTSTSTPSTTSTTTSSSSWLPQLEVFDPLGSFSKRKKVGRRQIPNNIITWLDDHFPLPSTTTTPTISKATKGMAKNNNSWMNIASLAVVNGSHQKNSFDCGVACLLYAEKCGQLWVCY
jgi:hypothetical protein